ncbi:MAG: thioredoxin family protein [Candidatus Aminicenantes bacterium]|nr:MAG: thioredoxin family protein [Candidatus Aminicenantes bacterium]
MEKIKLDELEDRLAASQFVILDFSSPGCAPCKKVPPLLADIMQEMSPTDIRAYEVDVTENIEFAQKYMVLGVPTIIIFKEGKEVKRFNSVPRKDKIKKVMQ